MRRWLAIGIAWWIAGVGCDRKSPPPAPAPQQPTTLPVPRIAQTTLPTSDPAEAVDNTPANCVMLINQHRYEFPPAMLRISKKEGHVQALLYSDDPKTALDDNYRGNGFYFQLELDVTDTQFDHATWIHQSQTSERADTPFGIFLNGHRRHLQPLDVRIRLLPAQSGGMKVEMAGTFLSVDPQDDLAPTQVMPVAAWLLADKR